jgi:hypothetical protein
MPNLIKTTLHKTRLDADLIKKRDEAKHVQSVVEKVKDEVKLLMVFNYKFLERHHIFIKINFN